MADKIKVDNETSLKDIKWGGTLNEFLWTFAGVDKKLLRQCPSEYAKYAGMGGTILCTSIMAMISGAYAIYFVFESSLIACAFGIFWGILILNLDRFIVSTMYSDGKHTISRLELWSGLPRIIMAIFLGVVISTPLEMKLFEERIDVQIAEMQQGKIEQFENEVKNANLAELEKWKEERRSIEEKTEELQETYNDNYQAYIKEKTGEEGTGIQGDGPVARAKKELSDQSKTALQDYKDSHQERLNDLNEKIEKIETEIEAEKKKYEEIVGESGFCQRYDAFAEIDDNNVGLAIAIWFIRLLFIIIEVAPVFFRMMVAAGPYDELLKAQKKYIESLAKREIEEIDQEYNTEITISTERNRARLKAETTANTALYEGIAMAQSEVISTAIAKWKKQELEKVEKDPSAYIKIN